MNRDTARLKKKYDRLAVNFLGLRSLASREGDDLTFVRNRFFDTAEIYKMKANFRKGSSGRHTPKKCDVLTTFVSLRDERLERHFSQITEEIAEALPRDFPCYRAPTESHHISLVMIHDVRPCDMNNQEMLELRLDDDAIDDVRIRLGKVSQRRYKLEFHGIAFGNDGAALALFIDEGQTLRLRKRIGQAVLPYLNPKVRKFEKPLIHATLFRPLAPIDDGAVIEKLKDVQRKYFCLRREQLRFQVDSFELARERQWQHHRVYTIGRYPLEP